VRDLYAWLSIAAIVLASTTGDVLLSHAMKQIGDLGELRRRRGLAHVLTRVVTTPNFLFGLLAMTFAFYSLLMALSWQDVSLVAPASASLTLSPTPSPRAFFCMSVWTTGAGSPPCW